jgi:hypothetical protein
LSVALRSDPAALRYAACRELAAWAWPLAVAALRSAAALPLAELLSVLIALSSVRS